MALVAPQNYMPETQNPFLQGLQGFQMAQQMAAQRDALEAQRAQQEQQMQMRQDMAAFAERQGKTPEDYRNFMAKYPQLASSLKSSFDNLNEQQKQSKVNELTTLYGFISNNKTEDAKNYLDTLRTAYENSGDNAAAISLKSIKESLDMQPEGPQAALNMAELQLYNAMGPEKFSKWSEGLTKMGAEARAQQLQPGEIKKQEASLVKMGIDNGLTQQQALKTAAETRKLDAETRKIIMDLAANQNGQITDPNKRADLEQKLGDKYYARTKNYQDVFDSYQTLQASGKEGTGPGDLALITSFMKMLDPGSVVRETEFANARDTAGLYNNLKSKADKWTTGSFLQPEDRTKFLKLAGEYMKAAEKKEGNVRKQIQTAIKNYGLNEVNVLPEKMQGKTSESPPGQGERTITKTGIDKATGRKVVQYSDGTIEYAQ